MNDARVTPTRLCRQCGDPKPLGEFRLKRKGGVRRETNCNRCHSEAMKAWRRSRSQGALRRLVKRAPNQLLDRRLRALAHEALRRFGGPEALANMLVSEVKAIHAARPGDPLPLNAILAVMRLHQYVDSRREAEEAAERDEYRSLTQGQLKVRMHDHIVALIRSKPEIAVAAAQMLGWVVIPPRPSA